MRGVTLAALLLISTLPAHPLAHPAGQVWLSIPRLSFRARVLLSPLPRGARRADVTTPWLWALQSPHPRERPIPFMGDEIDVQRARFDFRAWARFYTQRVLTVGPCPQRCVRRRFRRFLLRRPWPPHALLLRHCGLARGLPACTIVIARRA